MSYSSDNSSMGILGGIGSVLLVCMVVGLKVGARVLARASRNYDYNQSQVDQTQSPDFYTTQGSQQTSIVPSVTPYSSGPSYPSPSYTSSSPSYSSNSHADFMAAQTARREREAAEYAERERQRVEANAAAQARREAEIAAARENAQRMESERLARIQENENRMRELRERTAGMASPPGGFAPVQIAPPVQAAPPAADENAIPGFAVTNISQIKVKDYVFAQSQDGKWYPAMVQLKRGLLFRIRYSTNGVFDMVTADRIRLKNEPAEVVADAAPVGPAALRPVAPQASAKTSEEDDVAFIAKPKTDDEPAAAVEVAAAPMPAPVTTADPPAAANLRTWTNDTGEFKVEAELVSFEFDIVRLKRADGKILNLPIEKLSIDDQAMVRRQFP
ncbi:SHD1 domain-containing protein [Anatilimnocola sp. NA78]|uniref:SHD1 domain-containing protein n=1 Tax=Anatilimnocola sp. NA78 TaxID=3415683 RepID=UPI003CE52756